MNTLLNALSTAQITLISIFGVLAVVAIVYLCFVPLKTYFMVIFSGCYISSAKLIGLKSRKMDVKEIALLYVSARKAKININLKDIEKSVQSGVNLRNVIEAYTLLESAQKPITFDEAVAIEMATNDLIELAKGSLVSKTFAIENISATTIDGFETSVNVNISVKVNIDKFAVSLGLEDLKNTISAYVVDKISSTQNHEDFLKTPNEYLFENVDLNMLAEKSMYSLEGINVASVSIIRDLNAEKEIKSAEKEKIFASIEAERMKNAEEIRLIQTKTKIEDMKASVLEAEAEVPRALSQAIKEGRFSVMDYYKLMNLQADTALRRAIIGDSDDDDSDEEEGE